MIFKCGLCGDKPHSQDELHGKTKRVFNDNGAVPNTKPEKRSYRCTVCGHAIQLTVAEAAAR